MKTAIIKSNHGNHQGFNKKWSLEYTGKMKEAKVKIKQYSEDIEDGYSVIIVTQKDINSDLFNGGYYGYFPSCLQPYFKQE